MLIQQNDGSGSMSRPWAQYKVGFGDPSGNYWLGNDLLSQLTAKYHCKLKIDLQQNDTGNWYYAEYSTFRVLSEADNYTLQVGGYSGNASDAFGRNDGNEFTTSDRDNDWNPSGNCAGLTGGGFWYGNCGWCRLNAVNTRYFYWRGLPGGRYLQFTRMWLQCKW